MLLLFIVSILTSCGTPRQQTEPVEFSPDVLEWGMSRQEVLGAFMLTENDVTTEEEQIPADKDRAAWTKKEILCRFVFDQVPIQAQFVFETQHAESEWEIGLSRLYIEIFEDSGDTVSILRQAVEQSPLGTISLSWEELSKPEQQIMQEYYKAAYPGYEGSLLEFGGITAVGGQGVSDKEECYYTLQWQGEYVAVWNRYAKSAE